MEDRYGEYSSGGRIDNFCTARVLRVALTALSLAGTAASGAFAQQTTGAPCSPDATTTVDGRYLPNPPAPFGGQINLNVDQSKPCWRPRIVPPKGAPNVLLIMTDDQGYGVSGTFGGVIPTPALDRIAKAGLRYTQFHSRCASNLIQSSCATVRYGARQA